MRYLALLLATFALLATSASAAVERAAVVFRATAEVDATAIRLGDLADVRCPDAALARSLRELSVGAAPLVGGKSSFQAVYARMRVRSLGLKDEQVRFEGATQVLVTRPAQLVTGAALLAAARAAVETLAPGSAIEPGGTLYDRKVSRGRLELRAGAPRFFSRSATVPVEVVLEGKTLETVTVSLKVVKKVSVVVASRALAAGTILTESDVEVRELPETASGFSPVVDVAQAVGRQLTMTLASGATVPTTSLKQLPVVRRGDRVTLICAGGGFTLACTGEALADGALGQTIRVKNLNSGLELTARVSGPGTLQVAY